MGRAGGEDVTARRGTAGEAPSGGGKRPETGPLAHGAGTGGRGLLLVPPAGRSWSGASAAAAGRTKGPSPAAWRRPGTRSPGAPSTPTSSSTATWTGPWNPWRPSSTPSGSAYPRGVVVAAHDAPLYT